MHCANRLTLRPRRGLTLIELLVVLAIVTVLIGILIPAVQKAREAANNLACKANLKQIATAFHTHHDSLGYFPSGGWEWWTPPNYDAKGAPAVGAQQHAGWGFQILPYLEADNVWRDAAVAAIGAPNPVFVCPTRRRPQTITYPDEYTPSLTGGDLTHALGDYAASNWEGTGVVRQYFPNKIASIQDGLSNTLLVGEKRLNLTDLGQNQPDDNEGYTCGWDEDTIRKTNEAPAPDFYGSGSGGKLFGSSHPGHFNVCFADGSVRSLTYRIDVTILSYLGNKDDGRVIPQDDF